MFAEGDRDAWGKTKNYPTQLRSAKRAIKFTYRTWQTEIIDLKIKANLSLELITSTLKSPNSIYKCWSTVLFL